MSDWMAAEAASERRRSRGWYRKDPAPVDIHRPEPTPEDRRPEPTGGERP